MTTFLLLIVLSVAIVTIVTVLKTRHQTSVRRREQPTIDATDSLAKMAPTPLKAADPIAHQPTVLAINVFAKAGQNFAGYELLQTLLSVGLRFGEMSIFHRHQVIEGSNKLLFSVASAVNPGTFDIDKIGAYSCPGLTLFMLSSARPDEDVMRFRSLLDTARELANEFDAELLDDQRQPLTREKIDVYLARLKTPQA